MIKQHDETGLKYFHKSDKEDPTKYLGSGLHWKRHIKEHGRNVTTLWQEWFEEDEVEEIALLISEELNIVVSDQWANLKPENGLDGGSDGSQFKDREFSGEERKNIADRMKKNNPMNDPDIKAKHLNKMRSPERAAKLSKAKITKTITKLKSSAGSI